LDSQQSSEAALADAAPLPSRELLSFLHGLSANSLPAPVTEQAKWCLLDSLGCGLFGSQQPWGRLIAAEMVTEAAQGRSTLFGQARTLAAPGAALCNGTSSHGFELDDLLDESIVHPGAIVVPAALATAEAVDASGLSLLRGIVAGYEVMDRIGLACGMEPAHRGFHKTSLAGPVGAAVAAAVVMKLSFAQLGSAVGLACSSASGIKSFAAGQGGGMMKRMHCGRAAEAGVRMAQLAARGFTGPPTAIDGRFGMLEVFGGKTARPELLTKRLGEHWAIEHVYVKVFPCCSWIQASVQQLVALRGGQPLQPQAIKHVRIATNSYAKRINGETLPVDTMGAQYSLPYCAALALTADPSDPAMYADAAINEPSRRKLAASIEVAIDAEMDAAYPQHYGARVQLDLASGERRESVVLDPHGMPADPCTETERIAKFRRLATAVLAAKACDDVIDVIRGVDKLGSVLELSSLLRTGIV